MTNPFASSLAPQAPAHRLRRLSLGLAAVLFLPVLVAAQSATGVISGRVFNPATGEYIRNAEVRIDGTAQVAISEEGGFYRLTNAPAGTVALTATYTGHQTAKASLTLAAGTTASRDFELPPTNSNRRAATEDTVKLDAFIVATERAGQAKAISEQKQAMNVKTVVSADNFGDIAEGNIGEFLKFMPGITLDYVETDTRAARLGGLEARYGYVTLDGGTIANVNTGGFGGDTRQFEFEAVSINNIESIEVNKTLSADMPADAPAGTINLRTKSALDRKGQRFNYSLGFIGNQYEHSFTRTPRHDDAKHAKSRPTLTFDYSNAYFGNKLGVALNGAFTSVFKEQFRHSITYDYNAAQSVAAGRPGVTALNFKDGTKMGDKLSGGLKLDYQPFRSLRLSLATSYTYFSDEIANRNLNFRVSIADLDPSSTLTKIIARPTANANTRIEHTGSHGNKKNETTNLSLGFNYKEGRWTIDGLGSYSRARGQNGTEHMGAVEQANLQLTRMGWTAERPANGSASWTFTQTAGANWYDLNSYGRNDALANNITNSRARGKTEQFVGQLSARYAMKWELPTFFKAGAFQQVTTRARESVSANTLTYVGPTGSQLTSPLPVSIADFRIAMPWGGNLSPLPVPDKSALKALMTSNPAYFTRTVANEAANLDTVLGSPQSNQEQIRALYLLENTRIGKWQLQGGLRYENTGTISSVKSPVPVSKNPFATVTTNATTGARTFAAAGTFNYVDYRWSKGFVKDYGRYADWLPSLSGKYQISRDLNLKLGYNKAIKRPALNNIAGQWAINAADTQITIPNPDLKPERSQKVSAVLEHYFEPAGTVSLHAFETKIKGATETYGPLGAAEVGFAQDPVYGAYEFITFQNVAGTRRIRGLELSYSQQLTFFRSELLRGLGVFGSYSRFNSSPRPVGNINGAGWAPQNAAGGVSWRYRKFNASVSGTWVDESFYAAPLATTLRRGDVQVLDERFVFDVNLGCKLSRRADLFISGRNAFNAGKNWYFKSDGRMQMKEVYGGQWTVGVKGNY